MLEPCWIVGDLSECANRLDQGYDEVSGFGYVLTTTLDPDHHGLEQTPLRLLEDDDLSGRRPRRLDLLGLVTMATWVVTLLLALSRGNIEGWNSRYILSLFGVAGLFLALFLVVEIYVREPLIDLHLYRNPTYATATLVGGLLSFGLYSSGLLVTLFLQDFLEYTALQAATLMLPGVLLSGALSPLAWKLSDQLNPRLLLCFGFLTSAASTYWFALMDLRTEGATIVWA
jgi:hypothetical protein